MNTTLYQLNDLLCDYDEAIDLVGKIYFADQWDGKELHIREPFPFSDNRQLSLGDMAAIYYRHQTIHEREFNTRYNTCLKIERLQYEEKTASDEITSSVNEKETDTYHRFYPERCDIDEMKEFGLTEESIAANQFNDKFRQLFRLKATQQLLNDAMLKNHINDYGTNGEVRFKREEIEALRQKLSNPTLAQIIESWLKPRMLAGKPSKTREELFNEDFLLWFKQTYPNRTPPESSTFRTGGKKLQKDPEVIKAGFTKFWAARGRPRKEK